MKTALCHLGGICFKTICRTRKRSTGWRSTENWKVGRTNRGLYELMDLQNTGVGVNTIDLEKIREAANDQSSKKKVVRSTISQIVGPKGQGASQDRFNYDIVTDRITSSLECYDKVMNHFEEAKQKRATSGSRSGPIYDSRDAMERVKSYQHMKTQNGQPIIKASKHTQQAKTATQFQLSAKTLSRVASEAALISRRAEKHPFQDEKGYMSPDLQQENARPVGEVTSFDIPLPPTFSEKETKKSDEQKFDTPGAKFLHFMREQQEMTTRLGNARPYNFKDLISRRALSARTHRESTGENDEENVSSRRPQPPIKKADVCVGSHGHSSSIQQQAQVLDPKLQDFIDSVEMFKRISYRAPSTSSHTDHGAMEDLESEESITMASSPRFQEDFASIEKVETYFSKTAESPTPTLAKSTWRITVSFPFQFMLLFYFIFIELFISLFYFSLNQ
eukprot:TRINITY_DN1588_c0_g1_i4.p1 TRINITY_DN1588_c0_g1~~TRINITY_DN1588_c0_g1_i4.p1  ORF type:complete len:448 (+),score=64.97 TRINITY_DN1588_c0_g1_i4:608-1951(+)